MAWLGSQKNVAPEKTGVKVWSGVGQIRKPTDYNGNWSPARALTEGLLRVTWVYRSIDAIASNAARLPIVFRDGDPWLGEAVKNEALNKVLNKRANPGEDSFMFRYRLSGQVLASNRGAFIEVIRDRGDDIAELRLLPPEQVEPIKDPKTFVSGYKVTIPEENQNPKIVTLAPEDVVWIRKPHLFDPYSAMTPLEAAGVSVETDWLAKMYNRNFLNNDGRPGGMVVIKGDVMEEDKEELQSRFRGNGVAGAGRITVVASSEGADFVDTAVTPRDAQYIDGRKITKEEILMAFGVPEPVIGNAAGRTFDNAEMERLIFWMETMMPHLEQIMRPLDVLDEDDEVYVSYNLDAVDVLQRQELKRKEYALREQDAGVISIDEYRDATGREAIGNELGKVMLLSTTKQPYMTTDGVEFELPTVGYEQPEMLEPEGNNPAGKPPGDGQEEEPEEESPEREDDRTPPLDNEPANKALPELQVKSVMLGQVEIEEADLNAFKTEMDEAFTQESHAFETTAKRFLERQKSVVDQKLRGRKMRQYIAKRKTFLETNETSTGDTPYPLSLKAAVETVYDQAVWDEQLEEDMLPIITDTVEKYGTEMADELDEEFDVRSPAVQVFIALQLARLLAMNDATRHKVSGVLSAGALADSDVKEMADNLAGEFDDMIATRPEKIGLTEATASVNGGRHLVASQGKGMEKTWISVSDDRVRPTHVEASGQSVLVGDMFVVGGAEMQFPGDPAGPPTEVVNCRCAVAYSDQTRVFF